MTLNSTISAIIVLIISIWGCQPKAEKVDLLSQHWIHGSADCNTKSDPLIQTVRFDDDTWILRQNKCRHYEAPFMFLFFGSDRALLVDTGALEEEETFPLYKTVRNLIESRERETGLNYQLAVAHSHSHGDHHAGDLQFAKAGVEVAGLQVADISAFFKIKQWPEDTAVYELGGRPLLILPGPGHHASAISIYDAQSGILLTGDTFYPGRLYVDDWQAFKHTIKRLTSFSKDHRVKYLLGNHIEMSTTSGVDYPTGSTFQPNELPLPLSVDDLQKLDQMLDSLGDNAARIVSARFIISPK